MIRHDRFITLESNEIHWAASNPEDEGTLPFNRESLRSLTDCGNVALWAENPDAIKAVIDEDAGNGIHRFGDHPDILLGRRCLDQSLLIEIDVRAKQFADDNPSPNASARCLAAKAMLNRVFASRYPGRPKCPSRCIPNCHIIPFEVVRLRKTIALLGSRYASAAKDPSLDWLVDGLGTEILRLSQQLNDAEASASRILDN